MGAEKSHVDGNIAKKNIMVVFRRFANATENWILAKCIYVPRELLPEQH